MLQFNTVKQLKETLNLIDKSYLLEKNPNIKDWGKNHPRYLGFFGKAFSEGHQCFELLIDILVTSPQFQIELTDYDLVYMVVTGIFWRYYYDSKIVNYAIQEFNVSKYIADIEHIVFTPEINYMLLNIGIEGRYPQFRNYGSKLGFINCKWFIEPKTYQENPQCIEVDKQRISEYEQNEEE